MTNGREARHRPHPFRLRDDPVLVVIEDLEKDVHVVHGQPKPGLSRAVPAAE